MSNLMNFIFGPGNMVGGAGGGHLQWKLPEIKPREISHKRIDNLDMGAAVGALKSLMPGGGSLSMLNAASDTSGSELLELDNESIVKVEDPPDIKLLGDASKKNDVPKNNLLMIGPGNSEAEHKAIIGPAVPSYNDAKKSIRHSGTIKSPELELGYKSSLLGDVGVKFKNLDGKGSLYGRNVTADLKAETVKTSILGNDITVKNMDSSGALFSDGRGSGSIKASDIFAHNDEFGFGHIKGANLVIDKGKGNLSGSIDSIKAMGSESARNGLNMIKDVSINGAYANVNMDEKGLGGVVSANDLSLQVDSINAILSTPIINFDKYNNGDINFDISAGGLKGSVAPGMIPVEGGFDISGVGISGKMRDGNLEGNINAKNLGLHMNNLVIDSENPNINYSRDKNGLLNFSGVAGKLSLGAEGRNDFTLNDVTVVGKAAKQGGKTFKKGRNVLKVRVGKKGSFMSVSKNFDLGESANPMRIAIGTSGSDVAGVLGDVARNPKNAWNFFTSLNK